jgi:hypothetical protein
MKIIFVRKDIYEEVDKAIAASGPGLVIPVRSMSDITILDPVISRLTRYYRDENLHSTVLFLGIISVVIGIVVIVMYLLVK